MRGRQCFLLFDTSRTCTPKSSLAPGEQSQPRHDNASDESSDTSDDEVPAGNLKRQTQTFQNGLDEYFAASLNGSSHQGSERSANLVVYSSSGTDDAGDVDAEEESETGSSTHDDNAAYVSLPRQLHKFRISHAFINVAPVTPSTSLPNTKLIEAELSPYNLRICEGLHKSQETLHSDIQRLLDWQNLAASEGDKPAVDDC